MSEIVNVPPAADALAVSQQIGLLRNRAAAAIADPARLASEAQAITGELLAIDSSAIVSSGVVAIKDMIDIAGMLAASECYDQLAQVIWKGMTALQASESPTPNDLVVPLNSLLHIYSRKGDNQAANEVVSHMVNLASKLDGSLDPGAVAALLNLGQQLDSAGQTDAAVLLFVAIYKEMMAHAEPNALVVWLTRYANALRRANRLEQAANMLKQALADLESHACIHDGHRLEILAALGSVLQNKGDLREAEQILEQGAKLATQSGRGRTPIAGAIFHNLAAIYCQEGKRRLNDAGRLLERAKDIVLQEGRQESSEYAGELAQLAVVLSNKGESFRAEQLFRAAFHVYERASDTNNEDFAGFLTDAGELYMDLHRPLDAVECFKRAFTLYDGMSVRNPNTLATVSSALATSYLESGDYDEASRLYTLAIGLRHGNLLPQPI